MSPSFEFNDIFFSTVTDSLDHLVDDRYCESKPQPSSMENTSLFDILEREFCAAPVRSSSYEDLFDPTPILELEPTPIREDYPAAATVSPLPSIRPMVTNSSHQPLLTMDVVPTPLNQNNYAMLRTVSDSSMDDASSFSSLVADDVQFGRYDVICSRGREFHKHPGCIRYRELIKEYQDEYRNSAKRVDKAVVIEMLVDRVREVEEHGETARFLKYNRSTKSFEEMDEKTIRDKVGHALRAN